MEQSERACSEVVRRADEMEQRLEQQACWLEQQGDERRRQKAHRRERQRLETFLINAVSRRNLLRTLSRTQSLHSGR